VLAASGLKIWVANTGSHSVLEFDVKTGTEVHSIAALKDQLFNSDAIEVVGDQVWVANSASDTITILGSHTGDLVRVLHGDKDHFGAAPIALASSAHHVFVLGQGGSTVVEFAAVTDKLVQVLHGARYHFSEATALAVSGTSVWVLSSRLQGSLTELDAATGGVERIVGAVKADLDHPTAMSAIGGQLWIANSAGDHLSELSASSGRLLATPKVAHLNINSATSIIAEDSRVWLASTATPPWVACVRVSTHSLVRIFAHRFGFPSVFGGAGHVWVVDRTQSRVTELNPSTASVLRVLVN
jgi:DNA-binding beta-propeller fold protein YncE